jgi:hypothetical protein
MKERGDSDAGIVFVLLIAKFRGQHATIEKLKSRVIESINKWNGMISPDVGSADALVIWNCVVSV